MLLFERDVLVLWHRGVHGELDVVVLGDGTVLKLVEVESREVGVGHDEFKPDDLAVELSFVVESEQREIMVAEERLVRIELLERRKSRESLEWDGIGRVDEVVMVSDVQRRQHFVEGFDVQGDLFEARSLVQLLLEELVRGSREGLEKLGWNLMLVDQLLREEANAAHLGDMDDVVLPGSVDGEGFDHQQVLIVCHRIRFLSITDFALDLFMESVDRSIELREV